MAINTVFTLTLLRILYLIGVTAISGYIIGRISLLSIPIPQSLKYATIILPLATGVLLKLGQLLESNDHRQPRNKLLIRSIPRVPYARMGSMFVLIASTVLLTLLGTYAAPIETQSGLVDCGLQTRWLALFREKNAAQIRAIQDTFSCCGFRNARDMAWPFPDRNHGANACETTLGRTVGCLQGWRSEEQRLAGLLMGCVGLVLVYMFSSSTTTREIQPWVHQILPNRNQRMIADEEDDEPGSIEHGGQQRTLDYPSRPERYSDHVQEEAGENIGQDRVVTPITQDTVNTQHQEQNEELPPSGRNVWT